jgi:thiol-disulfide isomerase/thioredoxin
MPERLSLSKRTIAALAVVIALGIAVLVVVLYGKGGGAGNQATGECRDSVQKSAALAPFIKGEIAALRLIKTPRPAPDLEFDGTNGPVKLGDFKGRTVLFNLWATWCVPCRTEMLSLDRLQASLGGADFTVVALNMDTRNVEKVPGWLSDNQIKALTLYTDAQGKAFQALRKEGLVTGLPTTLVVDDKGCLLAEMAGPAEWAGVEALAVLKAVVGK